VFSLTPPSSAGGAWIETVLHSFAGSDGAGPTSIVLGRDPDGHPVLYGTTSLGGASGNGTVFELTPPASAGGAWTETVLYSFKGKAAGDGYEPVSVVTGGDPGGHLVLYGATVAGGTSQACGVGGCGTVFSLAVPVSPGGTWVESILHSFTGQNGDGAAPVGGLTAGSNGWLLGTTQGGGGKGCPEQGGCGVAFAIRPLAAGGGIEIVLHAFHGPGDGSLPEGALLPGGDGVFYGTTYSGGSSTFGAVFSLSR